MKAIIPTSFKTLVLIAILLALGCDPVGTLEVEIENATNQAITIEWYGINESFDLTRSINAKTTERISEQFLSDIGGLPTEPNYGVYDSISVFSVENQLLKTWKPSSLSKNIFDTGNDWELRSLDKWEAEAKFVIRDSDFDQ